MKRYFLFILVCSLFFNKEVTAHPGRTAADGCHYCRTNCDSWGVPWNERHCHGDPVQSTPVYTAPTYTPIPLPTWTPVPSWTPIPSKTPTPTLTLTPTITLTPTKILINTPTSAPQVKGQTTSRGFLSWLISIFQ